MMNAFKIIPSADEDLTLSSPSIYTHRVSVVKVHPQIGIRIPSEFPTTPDAVKLHIEALAARMARGDIVSYSVSEISTGIVLAAEHLIGA